MRVQAIFVIELWGTVGDSEESILAFLCFKFRETEMLADSATKHDDAIQFGFGRSI